MGVIDKIVKVLIPEKDTGIQEGIKYIDERMLNTPGVALDQTNKELVRFIRFKITRVILVAGVFDFDIEY